MSTPQGAPMRTYVGVFCVSSTTELNIIGPLGGTGHMNHRVTEPLIDSSLTIEISSSRVAMHSYAAVKLISLSIGTTLGAITLHIADIPPSSRQFLTIPL